MLAKVPHLVEVQEGDRMKIHDLKPAAGSKKTKQRVGRGIGGKGGKTAGRGMKGQGARGSVKPGFEGGQTPLHRRTPKPKGFNNPFRVEYHVVNLDTLEEFDAGTEIDARDAARAGLVAKRGLVKVLGRGEITKSLTVRPTPSRRPPSRRSRGPADRSRWCPPPWGDRRPPAKGTPSPTARNTRILRVRTQEVVRPHAGLSRLRNMFRVPDLRNKIFFTIFDRRRLPRRVAHPGAVRRLRRRSRSCRSNENNAGASSGFLDLFSGGAITERRRCSSSGSCRTSRRRSSCSCSAS